MTDDIKGLKEEEKSATLIVEPTKDGEIGTDPACDMKLGNNAWAAGLVLIGIGVVFLLTNLTDFQLNNWWALFILIPAISSLGNAVRVYRSNDGRLGKDGRGSLIGGLILLFVTAAFLFSWDWGAIWPFFLIIGGLGLLMNAFLD